MNCSRNTKILIHCSINPRNIMPTPRLLRVSPKAITLSIWSITVSLLSVKGKSGDISLLRFCYFHMLDHDVHVAVRPLFVFTHAIQVDHQAICKRTRPRKRAIIWAPSRSHERYKQDYPVTLHSLFLLAIIE